MHETFEARNQKLRHTIDTLAAYEAAELEEYGKKAEIAREHDLADHRVEYVMREWPDLVTHRRQSNRNPLDPDAVKAAYSDEVLQQMAVTDGGSRSISIDVSLDETFRMIQLLPNDLAVQVYSQLLQTDLDPAEIRQALK
jgi:hypothetical protein